jgi:hypothetical protein
MQQISLMPNILEALEFLREEKTDIFSRIAWILFLAKKSNGMMV